MPENHVHIGEVLVNGLVFDPKNGERLRAMDLNALLQSIPQLFHLLDERQVNYVLVGGIAMLVYVEGRNTQDIDLIVSREALEKVPEIEIEDENAEFARGQFGDLQVDFLLTDGKLFETIDKHHSAMHRFAERDIRCATVEGLLLLKLFALPSLYRQAQFDRVRTYEKDVADLIAKYHPDTDSLLEQLTSFLLDSDITELRNIVADIDAQIVKTRERFGKNPE